MIGYPSETQVLTSLVPFTNRVFDFETCKFTSVAIDDTGIDGLSSIAQSNDSNVNVFNTLWMH